MSFCDEGVRFARSREKPTHRGETAMDGAPGYAGYHPPAIMEIMVCDWSAECSADDPVLVIPWQDPSSEAHFIDLRVNPYDLELIPEAANHPALLQALRALNAARSPVFTAKCDAWGMGAEELAYLQLLLDVGDGEAPAGFACYIDMIFRDRNLFTSSHQQQQALDRMTRLVGALDEPQASLECILRPAFLDLDGPQEGFAVSMYVKALGPDEDAAYERWARALEAVVGLLRGKAMLLAASTTSRVR